MEIQNPSHEHPLVLRLEPVPQPYCNICSREIGTDFHYACRYKCNYYIHFLCALPFLETIDHPFHPQHTFHFQDLRPYGQKYKCRMCRKGFLSSLYLCFNCPWSAKEGSCLLDPYCALNTPTITCESRFWGRSLPSCHKQPMEVVEVEKYGLDPVKTKCYICELSLSTSSSSSQAYICKICKYFFHKSCAELQYRIRHPSHVSHWLDLKVGDGYETKCHLCDKKVRFNHIFGCSSQCKFYVCVQCLSTRPTSMRSTSVMYQGHDHDLLYLVDNVAKDENPIDCWSPFSTYCKHSLVSSKDFIHTQRYMFFCDNCDFNLHFLCGPLPCVIKHNCHLHPLTLFDSIVEDDSGEYYCDACETERDPRICVYYCEECKYVAHVHCVITEVVRVLQSGHGDVDFRIVGQRKLVTVMNHHNRTSEDQKGPSKPKSLLDIIILAAKREFADDYFQNPKLQEFHGSYNYVQAVYIMNSLTGKKQDVEDQRTNLTKGGEKECQEQEEIEERIKEFSSYTHQSFKELVNKLNCFDYPTTWNKVEPRELKLKLVNVGGYMITWNLDHVLKDLLSKYGNIASDNEEMCSPTFKNLVFFILCRLLERMSKTMIVDVTEDLLGDWYSCLRFVSSKGFRVEFIYHGLERIVRAYMVLQRNKRQNAIKTKLDEKISELEANLKRYKEYREVLYEKHGFSKSYRSFETPNYSMEEVSDEEVSKLEWKYVLDCLF